MGYVTNYKISFIHFGKTEMPKEADVVNALNSINPYDSPSSNLTLVEDVIQTNTLPAASSIV